MNKIRTVKEESTHAPAKSSSQPRRFIKALNVIGLIDKAALIRFMPFVFFLTVIAIIYIANSYVSENIIRSIDKTEKDLKELRSEYISGKSELMFKSKQTEVAKAVSPSGLKESTMAPRKIVIRPKQNNTAE